MFPKNEGVCSIQDVNVKEVMQLLDELTNAISPSSTVPWEAFQRCYIFNRTLRNMSPLTPCGRILAHAKQQVVSFRERVGINVCVFKIGVTTTPAARFQSYCCEMNFSMMWIVFMGNDLGMVHMLEAALISEFHKCTGCRNAANSGGEGKMNKLPPPDPPYFVYVTGARADQPKRVG